VFLVAAGVYVAASVIMALFYVEPPVQSQEGRRPERVPFRNVLAFENFLLLMAVIFGLQLVDKSFGPVLVLYLGQLGHGADRAAVLAGTLFSILAFSGALGNQLAGALLKRVTARAVIDGAVLLAAGALALVAFRGETWVLAGAMSIFGASVGTAMTTAYTAAGSVIPRHVHGTGFGFLGGASLMATAFSPMLSGLVAARSIRVVFFSGVVTLVVLALVVRRVMVERTLEIEPAPAVDES
jgi:DHA1 family multidrug resistance protein-like MFS transporter